MKVVYHPSFPGFRPEEHCEIEGVSFERTEDIEELGRLAVESDALLMLATDYTDALAKKLQADNRRLKLIQFTSAGFESAISYGVPEKVAVCNANDVWAPMVAEHAVATTLGLARKLPELERMRQGRIWDRDILNPTLSSIDGARIGILGYGSIGREIAKRLTPFGSWVVGISRSGTQCQYSHESVKLADFEETLPGLDVLINVLPASSETRKFINHRIFTKMKRSAFFLNIGRGATVDEVDLVQALRDGLIAGAALDVFETEPLPVSSDLWSFENVILSPHAAGYGSKGVVARAHLLCADNLQALATNTTFRNRVI